jgi:hypothetical protein
MEPIPVSPKGQKLLSEKMQDRAPENRLSGEKTRLFREKSR